MKFFPADKVVISRDHPTVSLAQPYVEDVAN